MFGYRKLAAVGCASALALGLAGLAPAAAAQRSGDRTTAAGTAADSSTDVRHLPPKNRQKALSPKALAKVKAAMARQLATTQSRGAAYAVGDVKYWLAYDDIEGIYVKTYRLRGVGKNIEVWVAEGKGDVSNDLDFPGNDCRNGARTVVTDAQVRYLIREFDTNIYPKESAVFSTPPSRNGTELDAIDGDKTLTDILGVPANYYQGAGNRIVTLVDNVRDDNFYDEDNKSGLTYIAGFHYSVFNEWLDRNVMSIDAFDWLHRTGATPPNEPSDDLCTNAPARPFLYESVFAHEYQHLLEYYQDADEVSWMDEGLADYAAYLTGYDSPTRPITDARFSSHIHCLYGTLATKTAANPIPRKECGPENSLTLWEDQGDAEVLADYGAAYSFMLYLADRFGEQAITTLHRSSPNGLDAVQAMLDERGRGAKVMDVLHEWAAMLALDGVLDRAGGELIGGGRYRYTTDALHTNLQLGSPEAYSTPGAPPNGSDYVRLRGAGGAPLAARDIERITFSGSPTLPTSPVEWTVDRSPEGRSNPALYSGSGSSFDRALITEVSVPASNATLTFDTRFETETGWDFGFVQVSTDGGKTYQSLANELTTTEHDPSAIPTVVSNVPGLTGSSDGWVSTSFDLSRYAGQNVLLSFRYVTDSSVDEAGWWVDNIRVGGAVISDGSSLAPFRSLTEVSPIPVNGWYLQLVGWTADAKQAFVYKVPLGRDLQATLTGAQLRAVAGNASTVVAIVTQDDRTETVTQYARYRLTVNGVRQPGG